MKMSANSDNDSTSNTTNNSDAAQETLNSSENVERNQIEDDFLAEYGIWTKDTSELVNLGVEFIQNNGIENTLIKFTEYAVYFIISLIPLVVFTFWPNDADSTEESPSDQRHPIAVFLFLTAFSIHFGAQQWMSFVSGLALYFNLSRHNFGVCQQVLFPRMFAYNGVLSTFMLIIFIKYLIKSWGCDEVIQVLTMTSSAILDLLVFLYFAPPMHRIMLEKYRLEEAAGSGQEVGGLEQHELVNNQYYQNVNKAFRRTHAVINSASLTAMVFTYTHLYFVALKINFQ